MNSSIVIECLAYGHDEIYTVGVLSSSRLITSAFVILQKDHELQKDSPNSLAQQAGARERG